MGKESMMLPLGTKASYFSLKNVVDGKPVTLKENSPILIAFICNHCPYVIHVRDTFTDIAHEYIKKGIQVIAINSNSIDSHPEDGPKFMKQLALEYNWQFPFAFDETQEIAKKYKAACTPDFYVFDASQNLFYRGRMDGSRPRNNVPVTGKDLRMALELVLKGEKSPQPQYPSMGCSIKWKVGNEPDYWG